jgi:hypothetical protein
MGRGRMETQTDGVEWVLGSLFALGLVAVLFAAWREFVGSRKGRQSRDESEGSSAGDSSRDDGPRA